MKYKIKARKRNGGAIFCKLRKLFQYDKTKKYLKEAENYDIVFTNKKSPAGNEPKGESCCPGFLFKHNVRL